MIDIFEHNLVRRKQHRYWWHTSNYDVFWWRHIISKQRCDVIVGNKQPSHGLLFVRWKRSNTSGRQMVLVAKSMLLAVFSMSMIQLLIMFDVKWWVVAAASNEVCDDVDVGDDDILLIIFDYISLYIARLHTFEDELRHCLVLLIIQL